MIDSACTERNFKEQAPEYSLVHLAMHGILDNEHPILSSLAFTESLDTTEDNLLQAYEIAHLHLNADLVVLSACETGFGKFKEGEGVMSLARSFMYAGVPSLVVSMWQVNDKSTSSIMQLFYKNLARKMDKSEALRQAKLSYIASANGIAGHPAFWAPFIQLGNHHWIRLSRKGSWIWWAWTIGLGVLVVGAVFAYRYRLASRRVSCCVLLVSHWR